MTALGEFELIAKYFADAAGDRSDVALGVGDDAALVRVPPGRELVVCADTIVSGVHFPAGTEARAVGHRALAVNLSDLAAMGAQPAWFTLALTLPRSEETWVREFARGLLALAREYQIALVGGDTTSGPLSVTVQAMGFCAPGAALLRSGARTGDAVFVSGAPGEAAAGLALLQRTTGASSDRDALVERFLYPQPRVALGQALVGVASAAIDVSDGTLADLGKLLEVSGAGARIDPEALLVSPALRRMQDRQSALRWATSGGDDYELCFTVPEAKIPLAREIESVLMLPLTRIGTVEAERGLRSSDGAPLAASGFDHFAE